MNWLKAIGYGIVYFAIMFVLGSIVMFGLKITGLGMSLLMLICVIVVLWLMAKQYKIKDLNEGVIVGLVWMVVTALLEYYLIVVTFNKGNLAFYTSSVLLGYTLVIIVPAIVGAQAKK